MTVQEALGDRRLTSTLAEEGEYADLTLPDTEFCDLDETDAQFLDSYRLNAPSDVSTLLQVYPLRTIVKIIKIFLRIADDSKVCTRLKFDDVNHLCPVRNAGLFDLIALVSYSFFPFSQSEGADEVDGSQGAKQTSCRS